jgi:spore coat protein A
MNKINRREFVKSGILGAAALIFPRFAYGQAGPFSKSLSFPPVLSPTSTDATTDYYSISMQSTTKQIVAGGPTTIWGYNGIFPGPTIKARSNRRVVVRQTNNLSVNTSVHLHGGHMPPNSDGYPTDYIAPGNFRDYIYPNDQLPATLWYHDHTMDFTGRNVYNGLAGFYLLTDDLEDALPLPKGRYEVPLVVQDRTFNPDGSLFYSNSGMTRINGFQGEQILTNGTIQPYHQVERRRYRFRILNGSNARFYEFALSNGQPFIQIGSDGGLLAAPVSRTSIVLSPAERADVIIDFAQVAGGTNLILQNLRGTGATSEVMQFRVMPWRYGKDNSRIPSVLRLIDRIPVPSATVTRDFTLNQTMGMGGMTFSFNNLPFSPTRIDANPQLNATEIWVFRSTTQMDHPIHIHDISWQIVDINGNPPPPWDMGWKDTFIVPALGTVRVIGKFTDFTGDYVFHCHILEHEDFAMMGQFRVS